jgi:hypothetical protein
MDATQSTTETNTQMYVARVKIRAIQSVLCTFDEHRYYVVK